MNEPGPNSLRGESSIERNRSPVFVIGCPRSGTNLLYDCLLSSGGFAIYRGRIAVHQVLIPRFGKLDRLENRKKIVSVWLRSEGFRRSGLDGEDLSAKLVEQCRNGGDFLRIVMEEIARQQNADRWALYDPEMLVRMATIKKEIPDALFVHVIRDGRDIAVSLRKLGEFTPFPWSRNAGSLEQTALYWEWLVQKGRSYGSQIPRDYAEIRFEDLVAEPGRTLQALGQFLEQALDYERIQAVALGTLSKSNSSFRNEASDGGVNPVQRWKQKLSPDQVAAIEWQVGKTLEVAGYALSAPPKGWKPGLRARVLRALFPSFLETKLWLKAHTRVGKFSSLTKLELEP
ncbi:MAG: sulfotransferase [Terriglobales bacterium]